MNTNHQFYNDFYDKFVQDSSNEKPLEALKVILQGYARAEDELAPIYDTENKIFPRIRSKWGEFIAEYLDYVTADK